MAKKSTAAEASRKRNQVKLWLLEGMTRCDIIGKSSILGVGIKQIDAYISQATKEIKESNHIEFEASRALMIRTIWECYHGAKDSRNWSAVASFVSQLSKLYGLEEVKILHKIERYESFTDEELMSGLNEFEDQASVH